MKGKEKEQLYQKRNYDHYRFFYERTSEIYGTGTGVVHNGRLSFLQK